MCTTRNCGAYKATSFQQSLGLILFVMKQKYLHVSKKNRIYRNGSSGGFWLATFSFFLTKIHSLRPMFISVPTYLLFLIFSNIGTVSSSFYHRNYTLLYQNNSISAFNYVRMFKGRDTIHAPKLVERSIDWFWWRNLSQKRRTAHTEDCAGYNYCY